MKRKHFPDDWRASLYYQEEGKERQLFYTKYATLATACVQTKKKQYVMLFHEDFTTTEFIDTNGDEKYGIFDPDAKKMIINPADWPKGNSKEIEKILGFKPVLPPLGLKGKFFCCSHELCVDIYGECDMDQVHP